MNDYSNYIGKVLDKRYKILELVGVGGMACVLRAQDLVMNRTVAIKILNDEYNGNEQAEHRFIDESKAVAMLSHKNIVSIYDVAIYPDIKYIVMEYLDGITLREYLDNKGALPWNEACIYILQVLRALEHAHSKGVIHRDIKPQNIILQKNGEIKVMDFGIAKIPTSTTANIGDKAVGTVYYISPEQASGKETASYSDLYSVGILLYEAVTGTLPFKANSPMAVAAMQVNDEPPNPRDLVLSIPVGVSQIILKAMMKNPADRFRSAHTMGKAIEWVLRNPDVIFSLSSEEQSSSIGDTSVVSIDMIDTSEITPYGEEEIAQSLGKKIIPEREREQQLQTKKQEQKKKRTVKKRRKPKHHSGTLFPVVAGIFIPFVLVALVVTIMLGVKFLNNTVFTSKDEYKAEFPHLIDHPFNDELVSRLRNGGYGYSFVIDEGAVTYTNNPDYEDGVIISTTPNPGHIKKGDEPVFHFTSIVVNRLDILPVIPDLGAYTKNEALVQLQRSGIESKYIQFVDETDPDMNILMDGQVTRTVPAAGDEYRPGEPITVYLCKRTESTLTDSMPNCVGMDKDEAVALCTYALYTVEIEEVPMAGGNNTVIEQSIPFGGTNPARTKVTLKVSVPVTEMPDVTTLSLPKAIQMLEGLGIPYQVTVYNVVGGASSIPEFNGWDDLMMNLELVGAVVTDEDNVTERTVVIFQSTPAGGKPPASQDAPLLLIAVNNVSIWSLF
ncbi:MAG: protein kinase [Oscillospiraceae bacterium]|nr:protein kinase [Oscillospiraceae bacterium]